MGREADISPSIAVELLDEMLLDVLEAILSFLHAASWDKKSRRNINGVIEALKSARATK